VAFFFLFSFFLLVGNYGSVTLTRQRFQLDLRENSRVARTQHHARKDCNPKKKNKNKSLRHEVLILVVRYAAKQFQTLHVICVVEVTRDIR